VSRLPKDAPELERRREAVAALSRMSPADYQLWTDGSTYADTARGGAAFYLRRRNGRPHREAEHLPACFTSFAAERDALLMGLRAAHNLRCRVPDEQPLLRAHVDCYGLAELLGRRPAAPHKEPAKIAAIRTLIAAWPGPVELAHVPAHVGLHRNEEVDREAKRAATTPTATSAAMDTQDARGMLGRLLPVLATADAKGPLELAGWDRAVYTTPPGDGDAKTERATDVLMSQLCTGQSMVLASYRHRLGDPNTPSPLCDRCGTVRDTARHLVFECPAFILPRYAAGLDEHPGSKPALRRYLQLIT